MLDVCGPLFLILFTYLDVVLLLKFSGMRPLASEIQRKLPELSLYVLIFPYLLLFGYIGILESLAWGNALLAGATLVAVAFIASVLDMRAKNEPEFFRNLSLQLNTWLIVLNAVILGAVSGVVSILICGGDKSIALVALSLGGYVLLSWKYLSIVNKWA